LGLFDVLHLPGEDIEQPGKEIRANHEGEA
jgi:hypothetical protein